MQLGMGRMQDVESVNAYSVKTVFRCVTLPALTFISVFLLSTHLDVYLCGTLYTIITNKHTVPYRACFWPFLPTHQLLSHNSWNSSVPYSAHAVNLIALLFSSSSISLRPHQINHQVLLFLVNRSILRLTFFFSASDFILSYLTSVLHGFVLPQSPLQIRALIWESLRDVQQHRAQEIRLPWNALALAGRMVASFCSLQLWRRPLSYRGLNTGGQVW